MRTMQAKISLHMTAELHASIRLYTPPRIRHSLDTVIIIIASCCRDDTVTPSTHDTARRLPSSFILAVHRKRR